MGAALPFGAIAAAGTAGGGAVAGGLAATGGVPDQRVGGRTSSASETYTEFGPKSAQLSDIQNRALQNYFAQLSLAEGLDRSANDPYAQMIQDQSRQTALGGLSGELFNATPEEIDRIEQLRLAQIQQARTPIEQMLSERITQLTGNAANRGVRGQALNEIYGQAMRGSADTLARSVDAAGTQASQAMLDNPFRRAQAQLGLASQGASFADQMRQQAIQNRQMLSNPAIMGALQDEYFRSGRQYSNTNQNNMNTQYGRGATWQDIVGGGFRGAAAGMSIAKDAAGMMGPGAKA